MNIRTISIIGAAVVIAGALFLLSPRDLRATPVTVTIPSGSGASAIGSILQRAGVIRWGFAFRVYATLTGNATTLKAGDYNVCACDSVSALVREIASGEALSTDIPVTIPEGMNVWEIAGILQKATLVKDPGAFARTYLAREGTLFPETYRFAPDATSAGIVQRMADTFKERAGGVTKSQLIIASILEKEAKTADDMALVSGIIQKRMQLKMPLQIDATVAYGWCVRRLALSGVERVCDVTQAPIATEIKVDGPYNTYTRTGLPPAPIANPGLQALQAAAHPKTSDYLYYLSTRDGSQIIYAKTAAQQQANRAKYLGK